MNERECLQPLLELLADVCGDRLILTEPSLDLLDTGLLDSLAFIELLEGIEDLFGVTLEPTRLPRECFRTAADILRLLRADIGV